MRLTTKEVVDEVLFSKSEVKAFENLIFAMHRCCEVFHGACENCPFVEATPTDCADILDFLTVVVEMEDNEDEN